jgi:aflatoxin B1 aldehyde reductase
MRFYAYNPLAGGLLTGKMKFDSEPDSGRFNGQTVWGKRYKDR